MRWYLPRAGSTAFGKRRDTIFDHTASWNGNMPKADRTAFGGRNMPKPGGTAFGNGSMPRVDHIASGNGDMPKAGSTAFGGMNMPKPGGTGDENGFGDNMPGTGAATAIGGGGKPYRYRYARRG